MPDEIIRWHGEILKALIMLLPPFKRNGICHVFRTCLKPFESKCFLLIFVKHLYDLKRKDK